MNLLSKNTVPSHICSLSLSLSLSLCLCYWPSERVLFPVDAYSGAGFLPLPVILGAHISLSAAAGKKSFSALSKPRSLGVIGTVTYPKLGKGKFFLIQSQVFEQQSMHTHKLSNKAEKGFFFFFPNWETLYKQPFTFLGFSLSLFDCWRLDQNRKTKGQVWLSTTETKKPVLSLSLSLSLFYWDRETISLRWLVRPVLSFSLSLSLDCWLWDRKP